MVAVHSVKRHQCRRAARERRSGYTIADFHDDAAGVISIGVLSPLDVAALMLSNTGIGASLVDWLAKIEQTQPLCATCDFVFTREVPPTMWLVAEAVGNPRARGMMLLGACADCCERHPSAEALIAAAAAMMKSGAWPDLRVLDPVHMHGGGRA